MSPVSFQFANRFLRPEQLAQNTAQALVFFLLVTLPLIFGAVHPIVQSSYTFLILVGIGGWLLFVSPAFSSPVRSWFWLAVPIVLISYTVLQSLPLPLSVVELLSPSRAARINMVNTLAQTRLTSASLSDNGLAGMLSAIFVFSLLLYARVLTTLLNKNRKIIKTLLYIIAGLGLLEGIYGLFQVMNPAIGILWLPVTSKGAAHGTIIYKNQYASLLNMCWPLSLAGGLIFLESLKNTAQGRPVKGKWQSFLQSSSLLNIQVPFFFFATGVMILAVIFSYSRGGILVMLSLIVLLNFFLPCSRKVKLSLMVLLVAFLGGYGSLLGLEGIITRFATIDESGLTRFHIYVSSLPMLFDHWLSGIGLGSFPLLSGVYLKEFPENILFDRVHNDYLESAIELGLPMATLFFAWIFGWIFVTGKKLVQKSRLMHEGPRTSMIVGCAAFCSLLGFLIHGMVDFGWRLPANAFYAVTMVVLISYAIQDHHLHAEG